MVLRRLALVGAICSWVVGLAPLSWQDGFVTRLEILALIETLNAELLSHPSATLTLEKWCNEHGLARDARIVAHLQRDAEKPLNEADKERLDIQSNDQVRYRHVQLFCGERLLSEADNWYVPDRLTPEMNRLLDETDTPFGRAVRDLNFRRETLSAKLLWSPLPARWDASPLPHFGSEDLLVAPAHLLEHRALLRTSANVPFSLVVETYTRDVLAFPLPQ